MSSIIGGMFCRYVIFGLMVAGFCLGVLWWQMPNDKLQVSFLNVGQGDSIFIKTPENHQILIDGGPENTVLEQLDLVMPYTDSSIDFVVLTHPHADHLDGLVEVLERFEVGAVLITGVFADDDTYFEFLDKVAEVPVYFAESGTDFLFGDLKMDVLYPFSQIVGEEFKNLNNSSVVLMIESGDLRILLTGDAEGEVEQELIERYFGKLKSDILKAGHHGSKTASSAGFLSVVRPDVVVVQVGEGNSFSHPHEESLRAFEALGATVRRNDLEGIIEFIF